MKHDEADGMPDADRAERAGHSDRASTAVRVAGALLDADAVSASPDEPITFRSGLRSPVYVDNRRLIFHPGAWRVVIEAFVERLPATPGTADDVVAGVETAGIPHSSALAYAASLPSVFVRKAAKDHGLARRVEGGDVSGHRIVLIEDMITTGGSSLSAVAALRGAGATVERCLAIISYGFADARAAFDDAGVELEVLTTFATVLDTAEASGRMTGRDSEAIRAWLADPSAWSVA